MLSAPAGHTTGFIRGVTRWIKHCSARQETESAFWFGLQRRTCSRSIWDRRINEPVNSFAIHTKSQTDVVGNEGCYLIQIPISIELDWPSGRDSPAANADRDQNHLTATYYCSERHRTTEMIQ